MGQRCTALGQSKIIGEQHLISVGSVLCGGIGAIQPEKAHWRRAIHDMSAYQPKESDESIGSRSSSDAGGDHGTEKL